MITAQEFIDELSRRLRDVKKKQWDDGFLVSALNSALGALTTVMPEAYTVNRNLTLVGGVEQVIDNDLHRIVSLLHNVSNVDGTPRRALTKADMSVFDSAYPHWRQDEPRSYIRHWFIDEFDESKFYVWPPAAIPVEADVDEGVDEVLAQIVRGTFTQTPYISLATNECDPEVIVPALPIDPGALGAGGNVADHGYFVGVEYQPSRLGLLSDPPTGPDGTIQFETFDVLWPDPSGFSGTAYLNAIASPDGATGASLFTFRADLGVAGNLTWAQLPYNEGDVVRLQASNFYVAVIGVNLYNAGTTQIEIDAYQAGVTAYYTALYAKWLRDASCDGTLPAAPINPGAAGDGASIAADGYYPSTFTHPDLSIFDGHRITIIDPTLTGTDTTVLGGTGEPEYTIDVTITDPGFTPTGDVLFNRVLNSPSYNNGGGAYAPIYELADVAQTGPTVQWDDPRVQPGTTIRLRLPAVTNPEWHIVGSNLYSEGVSVELANRYILDLQAYSAAVLAASSANPIPEGELGLASDLPVKRAHYNALQEYAMYYAYSIDDDLTANSGRAQRHWLAFFQLLNKREDANLLIDTAREITE